MDARREHAKKLQEKFKRYMSDFAEITHQTVEEIIIKYAGIDGTEESMYNTDIILGFLADYYGYYLHAYEVSLGSGLESERIRSKLFELDKEYSIFEKLVYKSAEQCSKEKKEGTISNITNEEIDKVIKQENDEEISKEDIEKLSKWTRFSYDQYVQNYRNKRMTMLLPGKIEISFEIDDVNLPHLLGIPKERNENAFEKMSKISKMSKSISNLTEEEAKEKFSRIFSSFSMTKAKLKNYLFQNFRLLDSPEVLRVYYDVVPGKDQENDSNAYIVCNSKNKTYSKSYLGLILAHDKKNTKKMSGTAQSILIKKGSEKIDGKNVELEPSIITSIFVSPKDNLNNKYLIGIFSAEEQLEIIYSLLGEEEKESRESGRILFETLQPYFKRIVDNKNRLENALATIRMVKSSNMSVNNNLNPSRAK